MYELRLKNFIVFRTAKLYDEIVPQMQEHYCDFHGFSLDLKDIYTLSSLNKKN